MCLVARQLEAAGIPTVILGSAIDIVEHCGVPRFLFTDFPLGNPCGVPYDTGMQRDIVETGLSLLESAYVSRTTMQTNYSWSGDDEWRAAYLEVKADEVALLAEKGAERRALLGQKKLQQKNFEQIEKR